MSLGVTEAFHKQEASNDTRVNELLAMIDRRFGASTFRKAYIGSINASEEGTQRSKPDMYMVASIGSRWEDI